MTVAAPLPSLEAPNQQGAKVTQAMAELRAQSTDLERYLWLRRLQR